MADAPRHRRSYREDELTLVFLVARSKENAEDLARRLGRTPSAIDWIWRWMDADPERFPEKAFNRLYRQIVDVRRRLGDERRGEIRVLGAAGSSDVA